MQRILNTFNAMFLLVFFCAPLPIMLGIVPNYIALPDHGNLLWAVSVVAFVVAAGVFLLAMRMNQRHPPTGFQPPGKGRMIWTSAILLGLYALFVPGTIRGALPAYASYVWDAPQTATVTVKDALLSSSGRYSCDGGVRVDGQMFFSRICGVPEDLRSLMKPGDKIEVSGPGHALGLRVETVRLLP